MAAPIGPRGRRVRTAAIELPDLVPFDGGRLEPRGDYDGVEFADLDLAGQDASDGRFLECRIARCGLDGLRMPRARIATCVLDEVHATTVDLADTAWRESLVSGGRLGAVALPGATWNEVRVRGTRLGFLNLAGAKLDDVTFDGCEIGTLDARAARLRSVSFVDCAVEELNVTEAMLSKVDLSGARLRTLVGIESLRGATVGRQQLLDLAPMLAAQLGLEIRDD